MAASGSDTFLVKYRGFVHIDKPSGGLPEPGAVQKAAKLLKSGQKTARAMHPLFARGLDTQLSLLVETNGLLVTIPNPDEGADDAVVMNHSMHKIAYVVDIGKCTCFIVKRDGVGKYKCHSFECTDSKQAHELARQTAQKCNEVFRKVRAVSRRVKKRRSKEQVASAGPVQVEEADAAQASELAEKEDVIVTEAIEDEKQGKPEDACDTAAAAGTEETIAFLDGVGDKFAKMVIGGATFTEVSDSELNLDNEMFSFGQVDGELEC